MKYILFLLALCLSHSSFSQVKKNKTAKKNLVDSIASGLILSETGVMNIGASWVSGPEPDAMISQIYVHGDRGIHRDTSRCTVFFSSVDGKSCYEVREFDDYPRQGDSNKSYENRRNHGEIIGYLDDDKKTNIVFKTIAYIRYDKQKKK